MPLTVVGGGKAPEDREYFDAIASSLAGVAEILIVGPAQAGHFAGADRMGVQPGTRPA